MPSFSLTPSAFALLVSSSMVATACAAPTAQQPAAVAAPHPQVSSTAVATPGSGAQSGTQSGDLAATAKDARVAVYDRPGGHLLKQLANPIPGGAPLTFLVVVDQGDWLRVSLAQRPNGSTGWVKADTVTLHRLLYRLRVSTKTNTLTLSHGTTAMRTFPVATGTGGTPTPHGSFYLTELLAPQNGGYGPYAFGLSAFSAALSSFGGGPGQIGLHGTDDAASIGKSASHGCIRMKNQDITTLAKMLPLGTPIIVE